MASVVRSEQIADAVKAEYELIDTLKASAIELRYVDCYDLIYGNGFVMLL